MDIKTLNYKERLELLKELFDSTNILINASYGESDRVTSDRIILEEQKNRYDYDQWEDDKTKEGLITINTSICTG